MGQYFFIVFIAVLLFWGWSFLKGRPSKQAECILYLVVKNQENCLEGIVRNLFRYLHKQETSLRIVLLVEDSPDQTLAIAQRLARFFSFEVYAIEDLEEWIISNSFKEDRAKVLLDLREKNKGWAEARRIRQFVATIRCQQQLNNKQEGLGS